MPQPCLLLSLAFAATGLALQPSDAGNASQEEKSGPILEGRIATQAGEPVEGVVVTLFGGMATRWKVGETTTDADGLYRFDPLDVGTPMRGENGAPGAIAVGVQIHHPEFVSADGAWWWDLRVPAVEGQVTRLDFQVRSAGSLLGVLLDEFGTPTRSSSA